MPCQARATTPRTINAIPTTTIPRIGPPMRRSTSRLHQAPRARLDVFGPLPHDVGMRRAIKIYDTTLRDGTQGEGVSFSMEDKVRLAARFDAIGIHYIEDRKSTRLNSSHSQISYAVFCLKKKKEKNQRQNQVNK